MLLLAANDKGSKSIEGITKLAKLDFLLRYPNCLERALVAANRNSELANVKEYERSTLESKMIRFKYGPWDSRYRRWLNLLASRGLATVELQKKTIVIELTDKGQKIAEQAINHAGGNSTHTVSINNAIATGVYNVNINSLETKQSVYQTKLSVQ